MYKLTYKKSVEKDLRNIAGPVRKLIVAKIQGLARDPRPNGSTKIRGGDKLYRLRSGEYRIIYRVEDGILTILVLKVGHRREVYRDL